MVLNESLNLNDTIAKGNFIGDVRSGDQSSDIPVTVYGTSQVDVSQWEFNDGIATSDLAPIYQTFKAGMTGVLEFVEIEQDGSANMTNESFSYIVAIYEGNVQFNGSDAVNGTRLASSRETSFDTQNTLLRVIFDTPPAHNNR